MPADDTTGLPALGTVTEENQERVVSYLQNLVEDSRRSRDPWAELANVNLQIYLWGEYPQPDSTSLVVNEIQNAILQNVVIQTREPPRATLEPVETGDPGEIYSLLQPTPPIPAEQVAAMLQPQPTGMADPMSGQEMMAPGADPQSFIHVNDELASDTYQSVFDRYWSKSDIDGKVREIIRDTEIKGWAYAMYEFDEILQQHRLRLLSASQVYVDPSYENIKESAYAGADLVLGVDEAKKFFPDLVDKIDAAKTEGQPRRPSGADDLGQADRMYNRPIVTMRVFWLRDQPCSMTPEYAVETGAVQQVELPLLSNEGQIGNNEEASDGQASFDENEDAPADSADGVQLLHSGGEGADGGGLPVADQQMGMAVAAPAMRPAFIDPASGSEVDETHPDWPTRLCLREIIVIEDFVARDRECEHWDIPLIQNVNRPTPGEPWGIGEPMYLKNLQKSNNAILRAMVRVCEFYKNPAPIMPRSMYDLLVKEYGDAHTDPGKPMILEDDMFRDLAGKKLWLDPPPIPEAMVEMQNILSSKINDQSGHTDALRGQMPGGQDGTSGRAILALQESGTSMIAHKSQGTGAMIERFTRLALHQLIHRLSLPQVKRIVSKYPDWVLAAIVERAKNIDWDVDVLVSSGSGQMLAQKKQEAMVQFQTVDPATQEPLRTLESTREMLNIDHKQEQDRWNAQMAPLRAQQAQQQQQEHANNMESTRAKKGEPDPNDAGGVPPNQQGNTTAGA